MDCFRFYFFLLLTATPLRAYWGPLVGSWKVNHPRPLSIAVLKRKFWYTYRTRSPVNNTVATHSIILSCEEIVTFLGFGLAECEICHKQYPRYRIKIHMQMVHSATKDFACQFCEKAFSIKGCLTKHMRIHTGEVKILFNLI